MALWMLRLRGTQATLDMALALAEKLRSRSAKNAWQSIRESLKEEALAAQFERPRALLTFSME